MSKNFINSFRQYREFKTRYYKSDERVFFAWNKLTSEFETCFFSVEFAKVFLPNIECITSKLIKPKT
jgi:hypothetical protein